MIYIIEDTDRGVFKVGYTENIRKRFAQIKTSNSGQLKPIAEYEGNLQQEGEIHSVLTKKGLHKNLEWFYGPLEEIKQVVDSILTIKPFVPENIELKAYQVGIMDNIFNSIKDNGGTGVLSSCPSSGKTIMAIEFMKRTLESDPDVYFLILAHAQRVIEEQWNIEIKRFGLDKSKITVILPQGLVHNNIEMQELRFRSKLFLIVDEAHEFALAPMVQTIIKTCQPKYRFFLTATPAVLIAEGLVKTGSDNFKIIPAIQLIKDGEISNVDIGVYTSPLKVQEVDFNINDNLKTDTEGLVENVDATLKRLFEKIGSRDFFKRKTMVVCRGEEHAKMTAKYFEREFGERNVSISTSQNDIESEIIKEFREGGSFPILVVVDRCRIGFNMPELCNLIDFSYTRNPNLIYQLCGRLMRKHNPIIKKNFIKIVSESTVRYDSFVTDLGVFGLLHEDIISNFNGKNLNEVEIMVKIGQGARTPMGVSGPALEKKKITDEQMDSVLLETVDKDLASLVNIVSLMERINKGNDNIRKISFGRIRKEMGLIKNPSEDTKEAIFQFWKKYGYRPSQDSKNSEEKRLGQGYGTYSAKNGYCYDAEFVKRMEGSISYREYSIIKNKEDILRFCKEKGYRPRQMSKDHMEKRLGIRRNTYTSRGNACYDLDFLEKIRIYPEYSVYSILKNKEDIFRFCKEKGYRPSSYSKDLEEQKLGQLSWGYMGKSKITYHPEFRKEIEKYPNCQTYKLLKRREGLLNFCKEKGYRPRQMSKDLKERRLACLYEDIKKNDRKSYNFELVEKIKKYPNYSHYLVLKNKEDILRFCKEKGYKPRRDRKDPEQYRLATLSNCYTSRGSSCYDCDFTKEINKYSRLKKFKGD